MKRKAVQGLAHNMCQMFLGHQVWDDLARLEELGGGTLRIEVVSGHGTKDEQHIQPLAIVQKLRDWLDVQLFSNGLDLADVEETALTVDYTVRATPGHWWDQDRHRTWDFRFRCRSTIQAFRREYSSAAEGTYQFA